MEHGEESLVRQEFVYFVGKVGCIELVEGKRRVERRRRACIVGNGGGFRVLHTPGMGAGKDEGERERDMGGRRKEWREERLIAGEGRREVGE